MISLADERMTEGVDTGVDVGTMPPGDDRCPNSRESAYSLGSLAPTSFK